MTLLESPRNALLYNAASETQTGAAITLISPSSGTHRERRGAGAGRGFFEERYLYMLLAILDNYGKPLHQHTRSPPGEDR